jgi:subtilisin family serine protease
MTAQMARLVSRLRRIALPLAVGVLLCAGLVFFGTVFVGDRAEGAAVSTTYQPGFQAVYLQTIAAAAAPSSNASIPADHVVVGLESGAVLPDLSGYGLTEARAVGPGGMYVLALAADGTYPLAEILRRVQGVGGVAWAEAETPVSACVTPNDPFYPPSGLLVRGQWALPRMGMPAAWDVVTGSSDVIVAIIDTGINKDLADFAGRIVSPYNALNQRTDWPEWRDNAGHGTAVAAVAVSQGNDAEGMAGVAWNVKIMPVKIADTAGTTDYVLADGIYWAVDHGADVINISFAGSDSTNVEIAAVNYALDHGVTVVAAAGNSYPAGIAYPAGLHGVIAVGATTPTDSRASFSSTGPEIDLAAPGTEILSHKLGDTGWGWASWSGTSFAAPEVTGVVALMKSLDSSLTPAQITSVLTSTADDLGAIGWDSSFGWGMVDADEAVAQVYGGSSTTTSASTTTTTAGTTTTTLPPTTTTTVTEPPTTTTTVPRFSDVSAETTPYAEQIDYLADLGVISGSADGLFHPDDPLKRQQLAKMIVLALGYGVTEEDTCPFGDVSHVAGALYPYHYVAVAWKQGITLGTRPGYFSPYAILTRAQMITMATRAANLPDPPVDFQTSFPNFSSVHYPYARKAANAGLLDALVGMGPDYDFTAPASRGETCALLYALLR